jgi:hypothetical protein
MSARGIEIRVHGIGDHGPWSSLGGARATGSGGLVEVFEPPTPVQHQLVLLNWSRGSRLVAGFAWILAIPFTLVNVAGEMAPESRGRRRTYRTIIAIAGIAVTLAFLTWVLAIVETILKRLPVEGERADARVVLGIVGTTLIAVGIACSLRIASRRWRIIGWLHLVSAGALVVFVVFFEPANRYRFRANWVPNACSQSVEIECRTPAVLDLPLIIAVLSTAVVLACALAAWMLSRGRRSSAVRSRVASGSGAFASLVVAILLVHFSGSMLRLSLDWLLEYPYRYQQRTRWSRWSRERVFIVYAENHVGAYGLDAIGIYAGAALLVLGVSLGASSFVVHLWSRRRSRRRSWGTSAPLSLSSSLPLGLWVAVPASIALITWIRLRVLDPDRLRSGVDRPWSFAVVVTLTHLATAAVLLFFLFGRWSPRVKTVLGTLADVLGFWPVRHHPLAGASYRDRVVDGIAETLKSQGPECVVVIVGHSQGSVLCAYTLGRSRRAPTGAGAPLPHLVTCGSPLASLYGTFFPSTFDKKFFALVTSHTSSWRNYWRITDPIASCLPTPCEETKSDGGSKIINRELKDIFGSRPLGHSGYWIDPEQAGDIAGILAESRGGEAELGAVVKLQPGASSEGG